MILMEYTKGMYRPRFVCDICEHPITDAKLGLGRGQDAGHEQPADLFSVMHIHKGTCDEQATKRLGNSGGWQELSHHLLMLAGNAGLSPEQLVQLRDDLRETGFFE